MPEKICQSVANNITANGNQYDIRDTELKGFLIRVQSSGKASYVLAYQTKEGVRRRYKIGDLSDIRATDARKIALKLKLEISQGRDPRGEVLRAKNDALMAAENTLKAFFENRYRQHVMNHHKDAVGTISRIEKFIYKWGELPLNRITLSELRDFRDTRVAASVAPGTINRELNSLRGLFKIAVQEGHISETPFKHLKPLKTDKTPNTRFLTTEEEIRLFDTLKARQNTFVKKPKPADTTSKFEEITREIEDDYEFTDYLMPLVILALNTGLRRGELLSLKWTDVIDDGSSKYIQLAGQKTKNSQSRKVPLNEKAAETLRSGKMTCNSISPNSEFVFASPKTGLAMKEIGSAWGRILKNAGIEKFRFHDLRHTFASKLASNGVDLNTIRELLGHADISTTLRYAHLSQSHLSDAVEQI